MNSFVQMRYNSLNRVVGVLSGLILGHIATCVSSIYSMNKVYFNKITFPIMVLSLITLVSCTALNKKENVCKIQF